MSALSVLEPDLAPPPERNGEEALYEIVNGNYVELPPMSTGAGLIASRLVRRAGVFAAQHQLGEVVGEILFALDAEKKLRRRPDVAFVSYKRWPKDRPIQHTDPWEVIPELAVEVVSPSDLAEELRIRVRDFFRAGVVCVWVVYPKLGLIDIYDSLTSVRSVARDQEIDGGTVLPGLRFPAAELFEGIEEDTAGPSDQASA